MFSSDYTGSEQDDVFRQDPDYKTRCDFDNSLHVLVRIRDWSGRVGVGRGRVRIT